MRHTTMAIVLAIFPALPALAHDPEIVDATVRASGDTFTFSVTLEHAETGWEDYADGWRVELEDGTVLGTRVLVHPHVNEQPFTRSLSGVAVPAGTPQVHIRARTLKDGWAEDRFLLDLN